MTDHDDRESHPSDEPAASAPAYRAPTPLLRQARRITIPIICLGAAACTLGAFVNPTQFLRSYLLGIVFWLSIPLGCLGLQMLQHVATGGWGLVLRRSLEAASRTIIKLAPLFIPILIGIRLLYPWAADGAAAESESVAHKAFYLNGPFFIARSIFYFVVWGVLAALLSRMSLEQDRTGDPFLPRKMRTLSAAGLVAYFLAMTFASIDWLMSLNPSWSSTIYGVYVIGGQAVSAMSFSILVALLLVTRTRMADAITPRHFHDFGKLLLAFVMLWAYFAFSQFLIIWSGNLPDEIPFYVDRTRGGWVLVSIILVVFHFALPFLLLLSRDLKRNAPRLAVVAGLLLVMRWIDFFWLIKPAFSPERVTLSWLDLATTITLGAAFIYLFAGELAGAPLLPQRDPLLSEALDHG